MIRQLVKLLLVQVVWHRWPHRCGEAAWNEAVHEGASQGISLVGIPRPKITRVHIEVADKTTKIHR